MFESEEVCGVVFEFGLHLSAVWAVSDDDELRGLVGGVFDALFDARPVLGDDGQVLFCGDSSTEEEFETSFGNAER